MKNYFLLLSISLFLCFAVCACGVFSETSGMKLQSSAFLNKQPIPADYTCSGKNVSPPLSWEGVPEKTRSLALICHDPDAPVGDWVHWVIYNINPEVSSLAEGTGSSVSVPESAVEGKTDFGKIGYGGPCPPAGRPHRYFFRLYALDSMIDLKPPVTRIDLEKAMKSHIIEETVLMGTFGR